jgi:hypothetical protein
MAPRFNEPDCPLYMETIFPLLHVELKLGWGGLPARYPTWFGMRDVGRRTNRQTESSGHAISRILPVRRLAWLRNVGLTKTRLSESGIQPTRQCQCLPGAGNVAATGQGESQIVVEFGGERIDLKTAPKGRDSTLPITR